MDITLNLINQSDGVSAPVVIFMRNGAAADQNADLVAWQVINNFGPGDQHPLVFAATPQVCATDASGNVTPLLTAQDSQTLEMMTSATGVKLSASGAFGIPDGFRVSNGLPAGAIDVSVFNSGKLCAIAKSLAPQQTAPFIFRPILWIGAASGITEGQVLSAADLRDLLTELSLLGVASADIVMSVQSGSTNQQVTFELENIVVI